MGDRREVLRPHRAPEATARPAHPVAPAGSAAVRRRRSLLGLAGLLLVVVVLAVVGVLPWWLLVLPVGLGAVFVAGARVAAQRRSARELQARRARAAAARRERAATVASRHRQSLRGVEGRTFAAPQAEVAASAPPVAAPAGSAPAAAGAEPLYDAVAEHVWEPVPVPLPTYVTAPKARRSVRVIDLTQPGAWTSGHLGDDEQAAVEEHAIAAAAAVRDPESIVTGEVLVERRRAVND